MIRRPFAVMAFVATFPLGGIARASERAAAPSCEGEHTLWNPLPDSCLGLIDTDRPHQTDTPHVVPAGHMQFESALGQLQLGGLLDDRSDRSAHLVLLDTDYKVGLVSNVDLQLMFAHAAYDPAERRLLAPGPVEVRAKFNVVRERGWAPAITLVPWAFLPVAPSQTLRAGPYVFWGWELEEHFELEMNAGLLFGATPKPPVAAVLASALTFKPVENVGVFVDGYVTGPDIALGTGVLWAFTRDMQVDLGTYIGVHGEEPVATPFLGFSVRR